MAAQADGDGGDAPRWSDVTASSRAGAEQAFVFEGSADLFQGCDARAVREWAAQCHSVGVAGIRL
jgi:hypothetical protein